MPLLRGITNAHPVLDLIQKLDRKSILATFETVVFCTMTTLKIPRQRGIFKIRIEFIVCY